MGALPQIPLPLAPARPGQNLDPLTGNVYGTYQGQPAIMTPSGNVLDSSGNILTTGNQYTFGTLPSLPNLPGISTPSPTSANPRMGSLGLDPSGNPSVITSPGGLANKYTSWIGDHVEDFLFVIVGLLLVAAALFSLSGTKTIIEGATKAAAKTGEILA